MKGAPILLAAIVATAPAWGHWTPVGKDDTRSIWYLDQGSIRAAGALRQVWAMQDLAAPVSDLDRSVQVLYEVDCQARRQRPLQYQRFTGRMGGGEPTRGGMLFGDWVAAGPGTVGSALVRASCTRI